MSLDTTIGGAAADSYQTLEAFQAYADAMGWALTATDSEKEAALRRARVYLDRSYAWLGTRATETQALVWPRYIGRLIDGYLVANDEIPQAILDAQSEMAYVILGGADPFAALTGGMVTGERVKAAVVETETTFAAGSARDRASYPAVDALVAPYVMGKAGERPFSVTSVRA